MCRETTEQARELVLAGYVCRGNKLLDRQGKQARQAWMPTGAIFSDFKVTGNVKWAVILREINYSWGILALCMEPTLICSEPRGHPWKSILWKCNFIWKVTALCRDFMHKTPVLGKFLQVQQCVGQHGALQHCQREPLNHITSHMFSDPPNSPRCSHTSWNMQVIAKWNWNLTI